jgi:hypothetical protein
MLKAYAKYHLKPTHEMPPEFMAEIQKRQGGSAKAVPYNSVEYLVSSTVGGQRMILNFDTGSADLYVNQNQRLIYYSANILPDGFSHHSSQRPSSQGTISILHLRAALINHFQATNGM